MFNTPTNFRLHATVKVQGEGKKEEAYTYVSEDNKRGVQFRWHSRTAFAPVFLNRHNMTTEQAIKLVSAFVRAGMRQHEVKGGYRAAIKNLIVRI